MHYFSLYCIFWVKHPSYDFKDGDVLDFFCPICHTNLECSSLNKKLAKVVLIDENNEEYDIIFSKVAGERCTYKLKGDKIIPFGEHQSRYYNLIKFR